MIEVSLGYSWPMDSPRMEASGFPEPVGPEIQKKWKNIFDKYLLHPKKKVLQELSGTQYHKIEFQLFYYQIVVQQ